MDEIQIDFPSSSLPIYTAQGRARLTERHFPEMVPRKEGKKTATRRCRVCSQMKAGTKNRKESSYMCRECDAGLCVVPCFRIYQTYNMSNLPFKLVDMTEGELYAELENIYSEMEQSRINGEESPSDCESLASNRDDQVSDTETTIRSNVLICSCCDSENVLPLSTIARRLQLASSASPVGKKSPVWSNVKTLTPPPDFTAHSGLAECVTNMADP
ncbi:unnamed protein product [Acanthoscelides obtectus]|uniref:PiggyBac transposable element-derived protein 4 C-terminal zinc-finger domain-containing protein n=1 Tax=Acanthoscelides obtectus TaxID=200917 RepID=A0A9P0KDS4_ACAOB|nr:unnamed protein product [Acanthoscelides obtectus]CAK1656387.1 PiggyBac transposable element-derived protein 4 [Acanthoscelides obtectus]